MPTPHINAKDGAFADTVLMPGDPLRAKFIAENFLENAELVTDVRNMFGYTGTYKGRRISVMGSGMGIPSISIYAKELITEYNVKNIIRVGSCGAIHSDINLQDVIIGMGASTDSSVNRIRFKNYDFAALADFGLLQNAYVTAKAKNLPVRVGNIFSADLFYTPDPTSFDAMEKYNVLGVEMEAAGLYGVAAEYGANALAILTVSDHIRRGEALSAEDRQTTFKNMIELALDSVIAGDQA
ncbi:purine-nucleoside phosphorylase [Zooshikella marina]|uniref:Purine nucleoside phosphorylase DeoD-type n=1 Tax=Zooshikella ganghwensis TaxID=202772 RepID=A0A4P9VN79_9GAMM|nr:purine-nucleoside phosphorylase [Zooshikella ganghwensis]MBU2704381.1 purine-nucleoside phosphorylase [Zooshikella ganghwensis]RDH44843.1 purine-nucleoside phosphorylase [Zooshikella ganghwensis]